MSPNGEPSDVLLARYVAGECTAAEAREIEARFAQQPSLQRRVEELRLLLGVEVPSGAWDTDAMWAQLRERTVDADPECGERAAAPLPAGVARGRSSQSRRLRWISGERRLTSLASAAAILLVVAGAGALWLGTRGRPPAIESAPETADGHYTTSRAQYATINLSDGSQVTLAPESRLTIPARFGQGVRVISLDGEAIFSVHHDAAHPFRVRARGALVGDIGTRFDLRAYANEATVTVAVAEGAVTLARARGGSGGVPGNDTAGIVLHRGDVGSLGQSGDATSTRAARVARYLGWADGRLSFVSRPLPEVLVTIGRWYDLDVRVPDARLASRLVTAEFSTQAPSEMIDALALAVDASVEREGRVVTLRPK
jgi:transmembrane sensor